MISRRYLRIKVFQNLYAFEVSADRDEKYFQTQVEKTLEQLTKLYTSLLGLVVALVEYAPMYAEEQRHKHLASSERTINPKIEQYAFALAIDNDEAFKKAFNKYKINWDKDPELVPSLFKQLVGTDSFLKYSNDGDTKSDVDLGKTIIKKIILKSHLVEQALEPLTLTWQTDKDLMEALLIKSLKNFEQGVSPFINVSLSPDEDFAFIKELYTKHQSHQEEFQKLIASKTVNWEAERLSLTDKLLMQLCLTEMLYFPNIPVKASINEYLEIAKEYGGMKSASFINGIVDSLFKELSSQNKIVKFGLGLKEH